jgi:hypothetical protein
MCMQAKLLTARPGIWDARCTRDTNFLTMINDANDNDLKMVQENWLVSSLRRFRNFPPRANWVTIVVVQGTSSVDIIGLVYSISATKSSRTLQMLYKSFPCAICTAKWECPHSYLWILQFSSFFFVIYIHFHIFIVIKFRFKAREPAEIKRINRKFAGPWSENWIKVANFISISLDELETTKATRPYNTVCKAGN